jgi:hypothetical protein
VYLRKVQRKNKDGTAVIYYQLAHNERHPQTRTPVARIIHSFGRADEIDKDELIRLCKSIARVCNIDIIDSQQDSEAPVKSPQKTTLDKIKLIKTREAGAVAVIEAFWQRLGMSSIVHQLMGDNKLHERALLAMTANRLSGHEPYAGTWRRWLNQVYLPSCHDVSQKHMLEVLDLFQSTPSSIDKKIFFHAARCLNLDTDLIFYSIAKTSLIIDYEDDEKHFFPARSNKSKESLPVIIALAVTKQGFPVCSWLFPDSFSQEDVTKQVRADLSDWNLCHTLFVTYEENLPLKNKYLRQISMDFLPDTIRELLIKRGRYKIIKDTIHAKEVTAGKEEDQKRYHLWYDHKEAEKQQRRRAQCIKSLEDEIARHRDQKSSASWTQQFFLSQGYEPYVKITDDNELSINYPAIKQAEQNDGKWVFETDDDTLDTEDAVWGHKALVIIENFFSTLEITPIKQTTEFYWSPHRIKAYVKICALALLIKRAIEQSSHQSWSYLQNCLSTLTYSEFHTDEHIFFKRNEVTESVKEIFKSFDIKIPDKVYIESLEKIL